MQKYFVTITNGVKINVHFSYVNLEINFMDIKIFPVNWTELSFLWTASLKIN